MPQIPNSSSEKRSDVMLFHLVLAALFGALSYVVFAFMRVDINIGLVKTSFHAANTIVVLCPLFAAAPFGLLGPALGLFLSDVFTGYAHVAAETFILKFLMALITYSCYKRLQKSSLAGNTLSDKHCFFNASLSMGAGLLFNLVFAPISSYLYHRYLLGVNTDAAKIFIKITSGVVLFNAILSLVLGVILYIALYKALSNSKIKNLFK